MTQANSRKSTGVVCLDIILPKPNRIEFAQDSSPHLAQPDGQQSSPEQLEYIYRTSHLALCWLPTKLAEWIVENLQDKLGFPNKTDQRAQPYMGWTPAELNHILLS